MARLFFLKFSLRQSALNILKLMFLLNDDDLAIVFHTKTRLCHFNEMNMLIFFLIDN